VARDGRRVGFGFEPAVVVPPHRRPAVLDGLDVTAR
jgi:hypothetical protein